MSDEDQFSMVPNSKTKTETRGFQDQDRDQDSSLENSRSDLMKKKQKKTNLNDRFKINKNTWASSPVKTPNRGFASWPHWGLSSPSPWQYADGVRDEENTPSTGL